MCGLITLFNAHAFAAMGNVGILRICFNPKEE